MKEQAGKTPLGWIITIAVSVIIAGVVVAMIFADNEEISNMIEKYQNKNNTVQTQEKELTTGIY